MLEFIVLGKIPGTNIQVTLAWFVLIVFGLLIYADLKLHNRNYLVTDKSKPSDSTKKTSV